jgi:hypothetical protein
MQEQAIKEKVKERYGKIALAGKSESCCMPAECCGGGGYVDNRVKRIRR